MAEPLALVFWRC